MRDILSAELTGKYPGCSQEDGEVNVYGLYIFDDDIREIQKVERVVDWAEYGFKVVGSNTDPALAEREIAALMPELIILGTSRPQSQGTNFIRAVRKAGVACEVVVLTAFWSMDALGDFFHRGGFDYLLRPMDMKKAEDVLRRFISKHMNPTV